jgi:hypothetical protein
MKKNLKDHGVFANADFESTIANSLRTHQNFWRLTYLASPVDTSTFTAFRDRAFAIDDLRRPYISFISLYNVRLFGTRTWNIVHQTLRACPWPQLAAMN